MGSFQDPPKERNEAKAIRNIGILSGWNNVIMPSLLVLRNVSLIVLRLLPGIIDKDCNEFMDVMLIYRNIHPNLKKNG